MMENSSNDYLAMENEELIMSITDSILDEIQQLSSDEELENLAVQKFYVLVASNFDMEMQNGGLCQFFMNSGHVYVPMLADALQTVGASQHAHLFLSFCKENNIDPSNIEDFGNVSIENYLALLEKYPFNQFDEQYFKLEQDEGLFSTLVAYVRNNLSLLLPG